MSITLSDVGALVNLPPSGDTISPTILISSATPKFDKKYTDSYSGMHELYNNSSSEPIHAERVAFVQRYGLLQYQLRTNASPTGSGPLWLAQLWLRAYFPQFGIPSAPHLSVNCYGLIINQLAPVDMSHRDVFTFFYNLNSIPSFFPFSVHQTPIYVQPPLTLNEVEAQTIDACNASLMTGFSLAPFNPTTVIHPLFEQFWLIVKRRLFATNVNRVFHSLEGSRPSKPSISSTPALIPTVPISIRCLAPSSSPSKSPPIRTKRSVVASLQSNSPPAQTRVIRGASSRKRLALDPLEQPNNDDNDDDAPPLIRRKDLFTSWEQVKTSHAACSSSASRPSTACAAFSIENMNIIKQAVLEYTTFMDMDIVNASATSQRDKFEHLSNQMARALELPSLRLPTDLKLSLKVIHQEINALLVKNVELKAKKTQYVNVVNEKESLYHEIDKAKSSLDEISSEVMVEDSLMMILAAQMKEIQAKMDDCNARLAAKKRNASQEVELAKSLLEHYSNLEVDEGIMAELSTTSIDQRDKWEKFREQMHSIWRKL
ncbi:hypothetical protein Adt_29914 [Abeliophyllum distichum]|uniref:Aminotransferase-like plant mobile domain-containing protein n=1 Tax=Abeliophyllum distichum TaxID=126358 RepID=A0ABD1R9V0_9LAMI